MKSWPALAQVASGQPETACTILREPASGIVTREGQDTGRGLGERQRVEPGPYDCRGDAQDTPAYSQEQEHLKHANCPHGKLADEKHKRYIMATHWRS